MADPNYIHLHDTAAFNRRFQEFLPKAGSPRRAYQWTENEYRKAFGENKYSGYESFRVARHRWLKRQKRNAVTG